MIKAKNLLYTSALLTSLSLALPAQACVVKNGKNCPSTVAHKVDHKVKLNKPGIAGGLGATTHTSPPVALGAAAALPTLVSTAPMTPADFVYYQNGRRMSPHSVQLFVQTGEINPDGSVAARGTRDHVEAQALRPQPPAVPNLQASPQNPAMTQAPVAQPIQAPELQGAGKRAKNPVPDIYAQPYPGMHLRPADFPIKSYLEYTAPTQTGAQRALPSAIAQRNPAWTNPDGSLTLHAIDAGFTVQVVNQYAPHMVVVPQPQAVPNLQAPPQNPAMTQAQAPVAQPIQAPELQGAGKRAKNPVPDIYAQAYPGMHLRPADFPIKSYLEYTAPTQTGAQQALPSAFAQRNPAWTNPDGSLTLHAIDAGFAVQVVNQYAPHMVVVPQPQATPNQIAPSQNPAMTQAPVAQTVQTPKLAIQTHAEVYTALHAYTKPHYEAYDTLDPAFHLVVHGFKEP